MTLTTCFSLCLFLSEKKNGNNPICPFGFLRDLPEKTGAQCWGQVLAQINIQHLPGIHMWEYYIENLMTFLGVNTVWTQNPSVQDFMVFPQPFFSPSFIYCGLYVCEPAWISVKTNRMKSLGLYYRSQASEFTGLSGRVSLSLWMGQRHFLPVYYKRKNRLHKTRTLTWGQKGCIRGNNCTIINNSD